MIAGSQPLPDAQVGWEESLANCWVVPGPSHVEKGERDWFPTPVGPFPLPLGLTCTFVFPQYNNSTGISYETLGPDELRNLLTTVRDQGRGSPWEWAGVAGSGHVSGGGVVMTM